MTHGMGITFADRARVLHRYPSPFRAPLAHAVRYGVSGIMTFLVNQEGVVYQKDLGPETAEAAPKITRFDPDASWSKGRKN